MQPNPPKSSRKATSRPPHAKTHSTPAPNSSTNQTRHAFFSSLLEEKSSMEMSQIRYVLAAAKTLNFTKTASNCNVSQPALTKAIKNLETELTFKQNF